MKIDGTLKISVQEPGIHFIQLSPLQNASYSAEDIDWSNVTMYSFYVSGVSSNALQTVKTERYKLILAVLFPIFLVVVIPTAVIIIKWMMRLKRLKRKLNMERRLGNIADDQNNNYTQMDRHPFTSHYYRDTSNQQSSVVADRWELPISCLKVGRSLGAGAFGQVLKGRVSKSVLLHRRLPIPRDINLDGTYVSAAVKMLKDDAQPNQRMEFLKEINLMKTLGSHVNIVSILGCCTLQDPLCLVVEHLSNGDLKSYLNTIREALQNRQENQIRNRNKDDDLLSPTDLLSFARQIAVGMEFLSVNGFIHRDLAARNVLVGHNKVVKIGDFGLTRLVLSDQVYVNTKGGKFPIKWMSVEAIRHLRFSTQSDVWSFGVVLFEIVTLGGTPYPTIDPRQLLSYLTEGNRMDRPDNCSTELYDMMLSCWKEQPGSRPSFTDLKERLEAMLMAESGIEYFSLKVDRNRHYYNVLYSDEAVINGSVESITNNEGVENSRPEFLNDPYECPNMSVKDENSQEKSTIEANCVVIASATKDDGDEVKCAGNDLPCSPGDIHNYNLTKNECIAFELTVDDEPKEPNQTKVLNLNEDNKTRQSNVIKDEDKNLAQSSIFPFAETSNSADIIGISKNRNDIILNENSKSSKTIVSVNEIKFPLTKIGNDSESDSPPFEPVTKRTRFGFRVTSLADDDDYEADDSLSDGSQRHSLSSCNEDDKVFTLPSRTRDRRYPKEKHPFFNMFIPRSVCRQLSNYTDSGISTSSYSEYVEDETCTTHF